MKVLFLLGTFNTFSIIIGNPIANTCSTTINFVQKYAHNSMPATSAPLEHCNRVSDTGIPTMLKLESSVFNNGCSYTVHQFSDLMCDDDKVVITNTLNASNRIVKINERKPICSFYLNLSSTSVSCSAIVTFENNGNWLKNYTLQNMDCHNLCYNSSHEYYPTAISTYDYTASNITKDEIRNHVVLFSKMNCDDDFSMGRFPTGRGAPLKQGLSALTRDNPTIAAFMFVAEPPEIFPLS